MRPGAAVRVRRDAALLAVLACVYLAISAAVTNSYYQLMLTLVPIWAVMGLSWNLLSGYSGIDARATVSTASVTAETTSGLKTVGTM